MTQAFGPTTIISAGAKSEVLAIFHRHRRAGFAQSAGTRLLGNLPDPRLPYRTCNRCLHADALFALGSPSLHSQSHRSHTALRIDRDLLGERPDERDP